MGQWDWAIDDYKAALRINPMLASSLYGRGLAKLKKGASDAETAGLRSRRVTLLATRKTCC
jgi:TPR repeat